MMFIDLEETYVKVFSDFSEMLGDQRYTCGVYKGDKGMYDGARTQVRTTGGGLEHFLLVMGLHQRSVLSMSLSSL